MTKTEALEFLRRIENMLHEVDDPENRPANYIDDALDNVYLAVRRAYWDIRAE
jgi:hypothetical protein